MATNSSIVDEFEEILKKSGLITQVNRIEDHFEVFFDKEMIPCTLSIKKIEGIEFANYESFMKFKAGPDPKHHVAFQILRGKTLEHILKQIEEYYLESFKKGIESVKRGFEKDFGVKAEDAETTEN